MERKDAKVEKEEAEKYRGLQAEIVSIIGWLFIPGIQNSASKVPISICATCIMFVFVG